MEAERQALIFIFIMMGIKPTSVPYRNSMKYIGNLIKQ